MILAITIKCALYLDSQDYAIDLLNKKDIVEL